MHLQGVDIQSPNKLVQLFSFDYNGTLSNLVTAICTDWKNQKKKLTDFIYIFQYSIATTFTKSQYRSLIRLKL